MRALGMPEKTGLIATLAFVLGCGLLSFPSLIQSAALASTVISFSATESASLTAGQFNCITDVTPRQASFDQFGGSGGIHVTAPADCGWRPTTRHGALISVP